MAKKDSINGKTGIFFKAKDGKEDVIAFRPGFVYDDGDDDEYELNEITLGDLAKKWEKERQNE